MSPRWSLVLALALAATPASGLFGERAAHAGDHDDLDALRKRFREGIALEEKEKWEEAREIFEEVLAKKVSPQVRFHIALCDSHLGKLRAARAGFQEALDLAQNDPAGGKDVIDSAPARLAEIDEKIPRLILDVEGRGTAEVIVDGEALGVVEAKKEMTLDPGSHSIELKEKGKKRPFRTISLKEGEKLEIEIPKSGGEESVKSDGPIGPPPDPVVEPPPEPGTKLPFFVVGGVGIAAVVASGVMIGLRQAAISEVRDSCGGPGDTGCSPELKDLAARGRAYEYAAWGLGVSAVACFGVATVLFFTVGRDAPAKPKPAKKSASFTEVGVFPIGVELHGTFE